MTRQLRGRRARAAVSSRFPYCWLSSWRVRSTSDIHWATGLYLLAHSWRNPPSHPMMSIASLNGDPKDVFSLAAAVRFTPASLLLNSFFWWLNVASWGTGWASTASFNNWTRQSVLVTSYSMCVDVWWLWSTFHPLEQAVSSPSDGRHACSASLSGRWSIVRGTGHLLTALKWESSRAIGQETWCSNLHRNCSVFPMNLPLPPAIAWEYPQEPPPGPSKKGFQHDSYPRVVTVEGPLGPSGWWHERGIAYWWKHCGVAGLVYYTEPASAVTPTCSILGGSGRNFSSIYPHSAGCIYEGTKEEEAGWGQRPDWVATMLRVLYGRSIGGVVLRQGLLYLGVKGIWSPEVFVRRGAIFGRKLNLTGPWLRSESGPNKLRASRMMRCLDASFSMITRKNPGWRTLTRDRTGAGSYSSGSAARHGLQGKPLRGLRVNGSVLCISMDWISSTPCHGNGLINMRIQLNRFGTHSREHSDANVHRTWEMIPCEASEGPPIGFTLAAWLSYDTGSCFRIYTAS